MAKKSYVTRRVIESNEYNVYSIEGTTLTLLGQETAKGKLSEKEMKEKYKVDKVIITLEKTNKALYGMETDEFMKYAVIVKTNETAEQPETEPTAE